MVGFIVDAESRVPDDAMMGSLDEDVDFNDADRVAADPFLDVSLLTNL